ncbi:MAG: HypC/HybG/HupF family hydrogenase formation chaperone [bacterium]|nr:MAG: HypC/HybG/HupF family hydrogenase formation chaperone [bacterium]
MCLAVPGKVLSLEEAPEGEPKMARVDFAGVVKNICVDWLPDIQVGEYVIVHVGFALNKIDEKEALETLQLLREMGDIN